MSLFAQVIFFVLTSAGVAALYGLSENGILTALIAIAVAELLIRVRGWRRTGVEDALWIGGLFAFVGDLPGEPRAEGLLLFAAASAIAGARVRNPLFGALAVGLVMHYAEERFDAGLLFALIAAAISLGALCHVWKRRSTEWLWIAILIILPLAGWAEADRRWRTMTIILYAAFGAIALVAALLKRHHAMFFAAMIGFTVATIEIARELTIPLEAKLAIGGAFLLALSFVVSRVLRDRTTGFVVTKTSLTGADDILEIAGTLTAVPGAPETRESGGGKFGGAGASGTY